jgi:hypothetical protein
MLHLKFWIPFDCNIVVDVKLKTSMCYCYLAQILWKKKNQQNDRKWCEIDCGSHVCTLNCSLGYQFKLCKWMSFKNRTITMSWIFTSSSPWMNMHGQIVVKVPNNLKSLVVLLWKKHNELVLSNDIMWEVVKESNENDILLGHKLGYNFKFMKKMICPIPFLLFWGWKSNDQIVPDMHKGQHHNL